MFGYVQVYKPEMKFKEYDIYHSYYCGMCSELKSKYGLQAQVTVSYDMIFLILLLTGMYEPETKFEMKRCIVSPFKHQFRTNEITEYAADMHTLYLYLKCIDDWNDEKNILGKLESDLLKKPFEKKLKVKYPEKTENILLNIKKLNELENNYKGNYEELADCSGKMISEIFDYKKDYWNENIKNTGYYLGKYIYILDAYDDIEKDIKKKSFNPFKTQHESMEREEFDKFCYDILVNYISECAREFEILPIVENADILKNILYMGVWNRFKDIKEKRRKGK